MQCGSHPPIPPPPAIMSLSPLMLLPQIQELDCGTGFGNARTETKGRTDRLPPVGLNVSDTSYKRSSDKALLLAVAWETSGCPKYMSHQ